jgi:hypothetical protein
MYDADLAENCGDWVGHEFVTAPGERSRCEHCGSYWTGPESDKAPCKRPGGESSPCVDLRTLPLGLSRRGGTFRRLWAAIGVVAAGCGGMSIVPGVYGLEDLHGGEPTYYEAHLDRHDRLCLSRAWHPLTFDRCHTASGIDYLGEFTDEYSGRCENVRTRLEPYAGGFRAFAVFKKCDETEWSDEVIQIFYPTEY